MYVNAPKRLSGPLPCCGRSFRPRKSFARLGDRTITPLNNAHRLAKRGCVAIAYVAVVRVAASLAVAAEFDAQLAERVDCITKIEIKRQDLVGLAVGVVSVG